MAQRYVPPEVEAQPDTRTDAQKRTEVFLFQTEVILIKILAQGGIEGVYPKARDNTRIEIAHTMEAIDKGLNTMGVRENRTDTGFCLFEKQEGIRVSHLLKQMWEAGFVLTDFFWQSQNEKQGPTHTFQFTRQAGLRPEDGKQLPPQARKILTKCRFNHGTVWCNTRTDQETGRQFRLDTVNLAKGRETSEPSRQLEMEGRTYRLV